MTEEHSDGPRIIASFGGMVDETKVHLRLQGPALDPSAVTARLGCAPTASHRRGDIIRSNTPPRKRGMWELTECGSAPLGPDDLIRRLLGRITLRQEEWRLLASEYEIVLWLSISFRGWNRDFVVSREMMQALAARHVTLFCDLWAYGDEE